MKIIHILTILLLGSLPTLSMADNFEIEPYNEECGCPQNSTVEIGANYTYAKIKIHGRPSFNGSLGGIQANYQYKPENFIFGGLYVTWREGKPIHSGASRQLTYVDIEERVGYTFASPWRNWSITPFSGFGYRYLGHKLENRHKHHSTKFEYNEFYIPLGFLSEFCLKPCLTVGLNFNWMPQIYPTVRIVPLKGARWVIKNKIENYSVELPIKYQLPKNYQFTMILKPFYEHWEDGKSTAKTFSGNALDLPGNSYDFYGIELNVGYSF